MPGKGIFEAILEGVYGIIIHESQATFEEKFMKEYLKKKLPVIPENI